MVNQFNSTYQKVSKVAATLIILLNLLFLNQAFGQVNLSLQLPPPGNFNPENFSQLASFNNFGTSPAHVRMLGTVELESGGLIFSAVTGVFALEPGFSSPHYTTYEPVTVEYVDAEYEAYVITTNNLPPGDYVICIRLVDAEMAEEMAHECVSHSVFIPSAPVLVAPADGELVMEPMPVFIWLPPAPQPPLDFFYKIKIVEVLEMQSSYEAMNANPAFFEENHIMSNNFLYPAYAAQFNQGSSYAWQVQSLMQEGVPIGENNGMSEVAMFNYSSQLDTDFRVWIVPEGEFDDWTEASICFTQVNEPDITYEVYFSGRDCDSLVVEKPHPFEAAVPDEAYRSRLRDLNNGISNATAQMEYWSRYCRNVQAENRDRLMRSLNAVNQRLEALRGMAAELSSEINFTLPTDCDLQDPCCNGRPCCEGLDPCNPDDVQTYIDRIRCMNSQAVMFAAASNTHASEFINLLNRWRSGAGHRGTMDFYHWWFSLVDDLFSFAFEAIDWIAEELEFDAIMEHLITKIINETLIAGVCVMDQDWCDAINAARTAKDKLDTMKSLISHARASGTMPPKFIFKLTQALYQQAAGATGVAADGWDDFANQMAGQLQQAYQNQLCQKMIIEKQLADMDDCADFCDRIVECYRNTVERLTAEKDKLVRERQANRAQALADFNRLMDRISDDLQNIPEGFIDECCTGDTITMGEGSRCSQLLQAYLMEKYGDVICYIRLLVVCNEENGQISINVRYQIMNSRREDCCGPLAPFRELIGERRGNTPGHDDECYPETPRERNDFDSRMGGRGSGSAEVVARRPNGEIAGGGAARGGPRGSGTSAPVPDNDTIPCNCKLEVILNGVAVASGTHISNIKPGTAFNMQTNGNCDPCPPGNISITRFFLPIPLANGGLMHLPPQRVNNNMQGAYDFEGLYEFEIELVCDDGTTCKSNISVLVFDDTPYIIPPDVELPHDAPYHCGSETCLEVYISLANQNQFTKDQFNILLIQQQSSHDLKLESSCTPLCAPDKFIRWELIEPDGNKVVYEGIQLYNITHDFNKRGDYYICVSETANCNMQNVSASKYVIVSMQ